jgi:hypothetical protein
MIWVGSFKSLQSALGKPHFTAAELEVRTWVQSEIGEISPLVNWLMNLIAASRCNSEIFFSGGDYSGIPSRTKSKSLNVGKPVKDRIRLSGLRDHQEKQCCNQPEFHVLT